MKKLFILVCTLGACYLGKAQSSNELLTHYKAYYKEMKKQGDLQGCINALTHLSILEPSQARRDTLAYYYLSGNQYVEALNVIGIEKDENASMLALNVKAVALKSVNQYEKAIEQFEILYKKAPTIYIAYDLSDLSLQVGKFQEAIKYTEYGIANAKDTDKIAFYETQQPYEVPAKAAFLYQKALCQFSLNQADIDTPIATIKQALNIEPNFNMALTIKQALLQKKAGATETGTGAK